MGKKFQKFVRTVNRKKLNNQNKMRHNIFKLLQIKDTKIAWKHKKEKTHSKL